MAEYHDEKKNRGGKARPASEVNSPACCAKSRDFE
jgi:hypothetical protein